MADGTAVLVSALQRIGVAVAFTTTTRHDLALVIGLRDQGVRVVAMATVAGAVSAADGYARRTGRLGVVIDPGGRAPLGDLEAVAEAADAEVPLLLLSLAAEPPDLPGPPRPAVPVPDLEPRHVDRVVRGRIGADVLALVRDARDRAMERPGGPVLLHLDHGALASGAPVPDPEEDAPDSPPRPPQDTVEHVQLRRAGNLVDAAQHVLIWAGGGALRAGAGGAVAELAEKVGAPVLTTTQAAGLLPARHPCLVGLPPHLPGVGALWDRADLVIAIGSDLDAESTQGFRLPQPETLIAINADPADAGRHYRPDVLLRGDARTITKALADTISYRGGTAVVRSRLQEVRAACRRDLEVTDAHELAVIDAVSAALPDRATVVADPSTAGRWLAAFHEWTLPRTLLHPASPDVIGYALPAAIGAAAAGSPDPVIAVIGDQGLLACLGDLAVLAREELAVTVVVIDDGGVGRLRPDLQALGADATALDRKGPDLAAAARTFGLRADATDGVGEELTAGLRAHIAASDPTVLVVQARLRQPPTDRSRWYRAQEELDR